MLFGFTGTGKTTIARAIGSEYVKHVPNGTFVIISSSFYQSAYIGISQKNITTIFEVLSSLPSCLVFMDEAEDTFRKRKPGDSDHVRKDSVEWLRCLDNPKMRGITCVCCTNKPDEFDAAIMTRFPMKFFMKLPDEQTRYEILHQLVKDTVHNEVGLLSTLTDQDLKNLARNTSNSTPATLKNIIRYSAELDQTKCTKDHVWLTYDQSNETFFVVDNTFPGAILIKREQVEELGYDKITWVLDRQKLEQVRLANPYQTDMEEIEMLETFNKKYGTKFVEDFVLDVESKSKRPESSCGSPDRPLGVLLLVLTFGIMLCFTSFSYMSLFKDICL